MRAATRCAELWRRDVCATGVEKSSGGDARSGRLRGIAECVDAMRGEMRVCVRPAARNRAMARCAERQAARDRGARRCDVRDRRRCDARRQAVRNMRSDGACAERRRCVQRHDARRNARVRATGGEKSSGGDARSGRLRGIAERGDRLRGICGAMARVRSDGDAVWSRARRRCPPRPRRADEDLRAKIVPIALEIGGDFCFLGVQAFQGSGSLPALSTS